MQRNFLERTFAIKKNGLFFSTAPQQLILKVGNEKTAKNLCPAVEVVYRYLFIVIRSHGRRFDNFSSLEFDWTPSDKSLGFLQESNTCQTILFSVQWEEESYKLQNFQSRWCDRKSKSDSWCQQI
ncbi:hypothetical protein CHS0354_013161 [Potamilus streckersoni]|uniref:Uncharacterized protein n=1 Tax=Potamilus streckersoni TaxID=2493646 RepID=A0AAE0W9M0_9BIVA|nr:hypothetical protein CHS0354_013161 [Potamilus streckersoni]